LPAPVDINPMLIAMTWQKLTHKFAERCEACGGWFDMRDYGAVLDHEGPVPHAARDQVQ
jgi:hypothetical protein